MSQFTMIEKEMMEDVFDMRGGYVLDFTSPSFSRFLYETLGYDIWTKPEYAGLSKAKALRALLQDIGDMYAGKIILQLIEYREYKRISNSGDKHVEKLKELGKKKLGKIDTPSNKTTTTKQERPFASAGAKVNYARLKALLLAIDSSNSTSQQKGYAFEKFLLELFEAYDLNPRASYKTEYDQIDGSFELNGNTVLLEAKYRAEEKGKNDLVLFGNKLRRHSNLVRGVYICLADIPDKTIEYFVGEPSKCFVVMTVQELYMMLEAKEDFSVILRKKFRHLDETGEIFKHCRML